MNQVTRPVELSVVIPNYNHAAYLPECLDSVVSQSLPATEIYVIDDASTDNSVEVIKGYVQKHPGIKLLVKDKNSGVLSNINEMLHRLRGTHTLTLAADDFLLPTALARAHELLSQHPQAGLCFWDLREVNLNGSQKTFAYGLANSPAYFPPSLVVKTLGYQALIGQAFFRTDELLRMGGFPADLRWHTDHFVCLIMALRHGACYVPEPLSAFRHLPQSYSASGMFGPQQIEVLRGFLRHLESEAYADVREGFRDSGGLALFGDLLAPELRQFPGGLYYLTPELKRWLLRRRLLSSIRHPVPRPVKAWFRRVLGLQAAGETSA